jgi:predicted nucleotidyltransferase
VSDEIEIPELPYRPILRCLVGSTAHGVNVSDGLEDRDELGVCIEDYEAACGLAAPFEQIVYRTAAIREGKHDAKSRAGDLDLTVYSLRKYVRLALKGNPTILMLLFAKPIEADARGAHLQELAPSIISRKAGGQFLGYLTNQRERLVGERGQKDVNRPELVERYGFDTKYAMHMLRLGLQGNELMQTGRMSIPMREEDRAYLLGVRTGKEKLNDVLTRAGELERDLKDSWETSPLPMEPDSARVERWMLDMYWENWKARRFTHEIRSAAHAQ